MRRFKKKSVNEFIGRDLYDYFKDDVFSAVNYVGDFRGFEGLLKDIVLLLDKSEFYAVLGIIMQLYDVPTPYESDEGDLNLGRLRKKASFPETVSSDEMYYVVEDLRTVADFIGGISYTDNPTVNFNIEGVVGSLYLAIGWVGYLPEVSYEGREALRQAIDLIYYYGGYNSDTRYEDFDISSIVGLLFVVVGQLQQYRF